MSRSNHSSITGSSVTGSSVSLDTEMNISASAKTLNTCTAALEIDNELINILTLNNHRVGKSHNKPKNYMRILPPSHPRAVDEPETSDKSALLGVVNFATMK